MKKSHLVGKIIEERERTGKHLGFGICCEEKPEEYFKVFWLSGNNPDPYHNHVYLNILYFVLDSPKNKEGQNDV